MSSIGKVRKFEELNSLPNVFQNFDYHKKELTAAGGKPINLQGKWREKYFKNNNPIILELACGRGEYTVGLSELYPDKNFIGVDLKGNRLWTGATRSKALNLDNTAFIRSKIELLPHYFGSNEVSEIWITFPDPFPKKIRANRRLTSPFFLNIYRQICKIGTLVNLKTDDLPLFNYSVETVISEGCQIYQQITDIYSQDEVTDVLKIQTYYERMHRANGKKIKYLQFVLH